MEFKAEMISCSNKESVGMRELGNINKLSIGKIFYFGTIYSSSIKSIKFDDGCIYIQTKNTKYTFKEVV